MNLCVIPSDDPVWLRAALNDDRPTLPVAPERVNDPNIVALRDAELPDGTSLVIRTSGSTGTPKSVALSKSALRASAEATHEMLGGPGQWLVALPLHLISGVQTLVRGIVAETTPVVLPQESFEVSRLLDCAERMSHERRYVSLVPVQLARLIEVAENDPLARKIAREFSAILVGGGALSLDLRQRAYDLGLEVRRSYGASETAGGCVYDGVEIGDTRVRIRDGEVQLAGSTLALGYVGDEALTSDRFIVDDGTRWYRTGDSGSLLGGMLTVTGRIDRVIVSGGVNVSLDEIERVTALISGWEHTIAVGVEHPEWGQRPVLVNTTGRNFDEVRARVRSELGPAAVPERVQVVADIPRLSGGKPDRAAASHILENS